MATISKPKRWLMERFIGTDEQVRGPFRAVDWPSEIERYARPDFEYPQYYRRDFHGVAGGYLQPDAPITYDPVTARIIFPNEPKIRQAFVRQVKDTLGYNQPARILDLGVGTGTAALDWLKTFPHSEVVGIDLSPYMLVAAALKLKDYGVELRHGLAEDTGLQPGSFDMVTASFLFHELPTQATRKVVAHALTLLKPGGLFAVYDGNQPPNMLVKAVSGYFPEPYMKEFMSSNLADICRESGFAGVNVRHYLALHQFLTAFRPAESFAARPQTADQPVAAWV